MKTKNSFEIDMTTGSLLGKILKFSFPLMLSAILQYAFNAINTIVVGRFSGSTALAAVGSTGPLTALLVNIFIGLSVGVNVLVARYYGAKQQKDVDDTIHTSILLSIISGIFLLIAGLIFAHPLLELMGTPPDVIEEAMIYIRIIFIGMPASMLYNFGAAILRAIGDTKRPLYILLVSGVFHVILSLVFVIPMKMGVAGVALATILSQTLSAAGIIICLIRNEGDCKLNLKKLKLHKSKALEIARIGLPAGLQTSAFSISNIIIQSSVNSFGSAFMAGNAAGGNVEGFIYFAMSAFPLAAISFTSQNLGAGKYSRLKPALFASLGCIAVTGITLGLILFTFGRTLLGLYTDIPEVIEYGFIRLSIFTLFHFVGGMSDTMAAAIRGLGRSLTPMAVALTGTCAFRIVWIFTIFQAIHTPFSLYISYPITWAITLIAHSVCYFYFYRKLPKEDVKEITENS